MHCPTLNLPAVVTADDYHEFDYIIDYLKQLGVKGVKFEELSAEGRNYYAVFYKVKDKDYRQMVKEYGERS